MQMCVKSWERLVACTPESPCRNVTPFSSPERMAKG